MPRLPLYPAVILLLLVAVSGILAGCAGTQNQAGVPTPTPAGETLPGLVITSPAQGAVLPAGDITISVRVSNFRLVPKYGQTYKAGEGHLHYYMGMGVQTGTSSSVIAPVSYISSTDTNYTWQDVPPGTYTFSVELANNDHSPFPTPIVKSVTVKVVEPGTPTATMTAPGAAGNRGCRTDADCVPEQCCHPTGCINRASKGVCTLLCTDVCSGPLDCGAGHCSCMNGICSVAAGPAPAAP